MQLQESCSNSSVYTEWNIREEILGNMRAAVCLTRIKIWQHGKRIEKEDKKIKDDFEGLWSQ